jgi:hypothetical protein
MIDFTLFGYQFSIVVEDEAYFGYSSDDGFYKCFSIGYYSLTWYRDN